MPLLDYADSSEDIRKNMELIPLEEHTRFYGKVSLMFSSEWKHPNTRGELRRVYVIKDARDPKLKLRFHGTRRACQMGTDSVEPCDNVSCCLCSILKNGFSLARARPDCMFGAGIYSSVVSSKASQYAKNINFSSDEYVMILCGVDLGESKNCPRAGHPGPCDSVEGLTMSKGGELRYPETVIYDVSRIKPLGIVVYSRTSC